MVGLGLLTTDLLDEIPRFSGMRRDGALKTVIPKYQVSRHRVGISNCSKSLNMKVGRDQIGVMLIRPD